MKTLYLKHILMITFTLSLMYIGTITIFAIGGSLNYHNITTVNYTNTITDPGAGSSGWTAHTHEWTTSPSWSMDQIGRNTWSTWISCDNVMIQGSYIGYTVQNQPWLMNHNVTGTADSMARSKGDCALVTQKLRGHNIITHWWQDGSYNGDGRQTNYAKVLLRNVP